MAWPNICSPKDKGGLGIVNIASQNSSLLTKFLTKLHSGTSAPWDLGDAHFTHTTIWKDIVSLLPEFCSAPSVTVQSGTYTSFWFDRWLGTSTLASCFPPLAATRCSLTSLSTRLSPLASSPLLLLASPVLRRGSSSLLPPSSLPFT